jgi:amino acid adenylation domain-containing protein
MDRKLSAFDAAHLSRQVSDLMAELNQPKVFAEPPRCDRPWLEGDALSRQVSYWRKQLGSSLPVAALPIAHVGRSGEMPKPGTHRLRLAVSLGASLKKLSHDQDVTLFVTLLAAFQVLLHRYTLQDEIVVGTRIRTVGGLPNAVLLHTDASGDPPFLEFLRRTRDAVWNACAHAEIPFEQLLEELQLTRAQEPNAASPCPVWFLMKSSQTAGAGSEEPAWDRPHDGLATMDLALVMEDAIEALGGSFHFNSHVFEDATIARISGHLATLLSGIVAHPERRLSALPILTDGERHQLLVRWNDTQTDYPKDACLHQLFEANEKEKPDAVALIFNDVRVTYSDLNRRANRLAVRLRSLGVGPEVRVGICVERSVEMVVAILGTLKAGGAYVPLDPTYPRERLAFMLQDAKVSVLLTQRQRIAGLPEHSATVVCLDAEGQPTLPARADNPPSGVTAENLAYVIYTSGSTGTPKGIMLRHSGVVNNLIDLNRSFEIGAQDRILAISSPSFDMCVYEILGTLAAGATIVMPEGAAAKDPRHWASLMLQHRVTVWNSAPPLLEMLIGYVESRPELHPRFLRVAILGGDWVPVNLPDRLKALAPAVKVIVLGGATEASIHSIVYPVEKTEPTWRSIPYGRPMANQCGYVLDPYLEPLPVGVSGELHLGGVGLARGYFERPDLTAEKFVPHPFGKPGDRLYKTGDLARYLPDGNIELIGRMDHQVKIHGHRIELGEIVAALKQVPEVEQAVAVAREDHPGSKRLAAYVVLDASAKSSPQELRKLLKEKLPDYMVPSAIVVLDKLPLSPNGKVDRRALPRPEALGAQRQKPLLPPRSELEKLLLGMWQSALGQERIGIDDNFFELGGSSIQAAVLINKLQDQLGEIIHLVAIFDAPTLGDFAEYLEKHYPYAVARICATDSVPTCPSNVSVSADQGEKIDGSKVEQMRAVLRKPKSAGAQRGLS